MATPSVTTTNNYEVMSYYKLRQAIGWIGILLAPILTFGSKFFGHCNSAQPSISHYYYSITHIVFVGVLCVLGAFLIAYRGKSTFESRTSNIAGIFAFGVAIFPTGFEGFVGAGGNSCQFIQLTTALENNEVLAYVGKIHFACAGLLFGCFIIFCLKIFQEQDSVSQGGKKKVRRNTIYKICGYVILVSIVSIGAITLYNGKDKNIWPDYIYWFETSSLLAFGFSWLLKGSVNWPNSQSPITRKLIKPLR